MEVLRVLLLLFAFVSFVIVGLIGFAVIETEYLGGWLGTGLASFVLAELVPTLAVSTTRRREP